MRESVVDAVSRPESSMSSVCVLSYSQSTLVRSAVHDPKSSLNHSDATPAPHCDGIARPEVLVFLDFVLDLVVASFAVASTFNALEACLALVSDFTPPTAALCRRPVDFCGLIVDVFCSRAPPFLSPPADLYCLDAFARPPRTFLRGLYL